MTYLAFAVIADGKKVYEAESVYNIVSVIDTATNTVIATIPVGIFPNPLTDNPFYRHELTKLYTLPNF